MKSFYGLQFIASDDEAEYVLPASEVARLEEVRYQALTAGAR